MGKFISLHPPGQDDGHSRSNGSPDGVSHHQVLAANAEPGCLSILRDAAAGQPLSLITVDDLMQVTRTVREHSIDLVILDDHDEEMTVAQTLRKLAGIGFEGKKMVISASSDADAAVAMMRDGADDYLTKPFSAHAALERIQRLLEIGAEETRDEPTPAAEPWQEHGFVAVSASTREVVRMARQVANKGRSSILIRGETGVGKDLLARLVHHHSERNKQPFVEINCPSFPRSLLESELFGHERGAFTGANTQKKGLIESADGGTVFLNEIGELDLPVQAKLLQFLERRVFRRVGSVKERSVDVRIIAATNQPLEERVSEGHFRADLYYRLNVVPLNLPPLRERREDIPALVEFFMERLREEFDRPRLRLDHEAFEAVVNHDWPGNVRELKNTLERLALLSPAEQIPYDLLPDVIKQAPQRPTGGMMIVQGSGSLEETERNLLIQALEQSGWNVSLAARSLRISRDTMRYRIKKYGIRMPASL